MKVERVKELVKEGKLDKALSIVKNFKREIGITKEELKQLKLSYECLTYPNFYKQLDKDIDLEIMRGYEILERVYGEKDE